MLNEKDMKLLANEYREDRNEAYAELSEKLNYMILEFQRMKEKVDWAKENGRRVNIDTVNMTMLMSTMMMMTNTASRIAKDNELMMAFGDMK